MTREEYERLRDKCITTYKTVYKDSLAFDINEVAKEVRLRLLEDEVYLMKTKAIRATLFASQLSILDDVVAENAILEDGKGSAIILKALEMKNRLLLDDLSETKDESNALNVAFASMDAESFNELKTVEVVSGSNGGALGADFGVSEEGDSFEARLKAEMKEKLDDLAEKEGKH